MFYFPEELEFQEENKMCIAHTTLNNLWPLDSKIITVYRLDFRHWLD